MPEIPGKTLIDRDGGTRSLVLDPMNDWSTFVEFWIADPDDGRSVLLDSAQTRELIVALTERAAALEARQATVSPASDGHPF
jgi:hypothetical protein